MQGSIRKKGRSNLVVSITKVNVTVDIAFAKVFLSIFPSEYSLEYLNSLKENRFKIRHSLSQIMKNQLRKVPELNFYIDDSLDYIQNIESALKNPENPILGENLST